MCHRRIGDLYRLPWQGKEYTLQVDRILDEDRFAVRVVDGCGVLEDGFEQVLTCGDSIDRALEELNDNLTELSFSYEDCVFPQINKDL